MNKVSKGLVLVLASTLMSAAFATTVTTGNVNAAAALGQAGQGNQAGLLNQSGKNNQAGTVNNQSNSAPVREYSASSPTPTPTFGGGQQGLFNTQKSQTVGNISVEQSNNKSKSDLQLNTGAGNAGNNVGNIGSNVASYNIQN